MIEPVPKAVSIWEMARSSASTLDLVSVIDEDLRAMVPS
jgi:hypothetical protein